MKILIICGSTASGKTSLALKIAKKTTKTCIISADSRQGYQGLPILTGQDIPKGFIRHEADHIRYQKLPGVYFSLGSINIWGVDQVPPTDTLNISSLTKFVWQVIEKESLDGKKIIIVGGTGLYLRALAEPMEDIHRGFNAKLRKNLSKLTVKELQKKLRSIDANRYNTLNQSDKSNPRRLIRAIEILTYPKAKKPKYFSMQKKASIRWLGLRTNPTLLEKNIRARVISRLNNNVIGEVKILKSIHKDKKNPIYSTLGLNQIIKYIDKKIDKTELIDTWVREDIRYTKRQLTWFKKQSGIIWYDLDSHQKKLINDLSIWLKTTKHSTTR